MKHFRIIFIVLIIITLSACTSQSKNDINNFILKYNEISSTKIDINRVLARKTDQYVYEYMADNHTLLCFYSNNNGIITQCTVTRDEKDINFREICENISVVFSGLSSETVHKNFELIKSGGKLNYDEYMFIVNNCKIGKTFIVNYADDELNTNPNPTLKGHIDEKDISRPTDIITTEKSLGIN